MDRSTPAPTGARRPPQSPGEERADLVFDSIASHARGVRQHCIEIVDRAGFHQEELVNFAMAAKDLAAQIGLLAEIGQRDVGGIVSIDPEAWLLPPAYHAIRNSGEQQ